MMQMLKFALPRDIAFFLFTRKYFLLFLNDETTKE